MDRRFLSATFGTALIIFWLTALQVSGLDIGSAAPDFTLEDAMSGNFIGLENCRGKVVLLDFFATWCGPCRQAIDEDLLPLYSQYEGNPNVVFLSIDIWEPNITAQQLRTFASDHKMKWPILMGSKTDIDKEYDVRGVPTLYIVDENGIIKHLHLGSPGLNTIKTEIDGLLPPSADNTPPPKPSTLSPLEGTKLEDKRPTFDWSDVLDTSGVIYTLEVNDDADFSSPLLSKTGLTSSQYRLSEVETLSDGTYYWRVRASDKAGNLGEWSRISSFTVESPTPENYKVALVIAGVLLGLLVAVYLTKRIG